MAVPTLESLVAVLGKHLRPVPGSTVEAVPLSAVHISELVDPSTWLSGGELLLTTGLTLPADSAGCEQYVARLHAVGVVAIGFGLGPVHEDVPAPLLAACRSAGMPLLVVPPPTPFITISRAYWSEVARSGERELTDQLAAERALIDAAGSRDPVLATLRTLSKWLLGWAASYTADGDLAQVYPAGARDQAAAIRDDLRRAGSHGTRAALSVVAERRQVAAFPLQSAGQRVGYVAVATSQRMTSASRRTVLTAATLLGLATSQEAIEAAARAAHLAGLARLLEAGAVDAARRLAHDAGSAVPGERVRLLVLRSAALGRVIDSVLRWSEPVAGRPWDDERAWYAFPATVADEQDLVLRLRSLDPAATAVLSPSVPIASVPAERLRQAAVLAETPAGVVDLQHDRVAEAARLVERLDNPALVASLRAYLGHRGQWEAAARSLGVHRNTLRYRINRVRELTGVDLDEPDVAAVLWLALRGIRPDPA